MKIITVSGVHSGVGKTTLVEQILKQLKNWSALKVTVTRKSSCPREAACGVCEEQETPFSIISNFRVINQKGKDTQRMKKAGAKKVLWLKAKPEGLKDGLKQALKKFSATKRGGSAKKFGGKDTPGVVIEGTSILKYLKPDLGLFIDEKGKIRLLRCS